MFVSSANNFGTSALNAFKISLIYIRNRRGHRTELCGAAHSTIFDYNVKTSTFFKLLAGAKVGFKSFQRITSNFVVS